MKHTHPQRPKKPERSGHQGPRRLGGMRRRILEEKPFIGEVLTPAGIAVRMEEVLSAPLAHIGYEIVRIQVIGKHRLNIQVMIERADREPVNIDDCVAANELTRHWLNLENFIAQDYLLEMSSPGWDRPLVKPDHFKRFCGQKIQLRTRYPVEGQKRFSGVLECATDHAVTLAWDATRVELSYDQIEQARLVP